MTEKIKNEANECFEKATYQGKKWFLKFPYKVIETDVVFLESEAEFKQGSGFALVNDANKYSTKIRYNAIESIGTQVKFSVPNIVAAIFIAIMAVFAGLAGIAPLGGVFGAIVIVIPVMLFLGRTAVTSIQYSDHGSSYIYEVPTEFKTEAEELEEKLNARR